MKDIFFVPGSSSVHLWIAGTQHKPPPSPHQTEQCAALSGIVRQAHQRADALIPSGASGANAVIGVADAWVDSTPMMVISGQSRSDETVDGTELRQLGIQELNVTEIVKPISKYAVMIREPNTIKYHLEKALYLATTGRPGPVWIDIPIDIQGMVIDEEELVSFNPKELKLKPADPRLKDKASETLRLLKSAKRPVLLVGNGVRLSNAQEDVMKLVEMLGIPVITSRRGADLMADSHPLFLAGRARTDCAVPILSCRTRPLDRLGSRLTLPQVGRNYKAFARGAKQILVDIDPAELKKRLCMRI